MKNFFELKKLIFGSLFATAFHLSPLTAEFSNFPQPSIDDNQVLTAVWENYDMVNMHTFIQGFYGNISAPVSLSDSVNYKSTNPIIATAPNPGSSTKAIAVWIARDANNRYIIQGRIATDTNGWNNPTQIFSATDGSEVPNNDYKASISPSGTALVVSWSAQISSLNATALRWAVSTDAGSTWTIQTTDP
jgi:hypothetical protein